MTWPKPPRPEWMDATTYAQLPAELRLREIRVRVLQKGFRTKELLLVTTLLDVEHYTHDDLAELYRNRWHAELNLRSLKTVMVDHLRCKARNMKSFGERSRSRTKPTKGCDGCELWNSTTNEGYAGRLTERFGKSNPGLADDFDVVELAPGRVIHAAQWSDLIGRPRKSKPWLNELPRLVFVGDMADNFSHDVPFDYLYEEVTLPTGGGSAPAVRQLPTEGRTGCSADSLQGIRVAHPHVA